MREETATLDGMPPIKKIRKRVVKKFHSLKNVPVEVAVRRQVAEEIGEGEPTKDEKYILLQKYGATALRIDRQVTRPKWQTEGIWKRKLNEFIQATRGLVKPQQRPRQNFTRTTSTGSTTTGGQFRPNATKPFQYRGATTERYPSSQRPQQARRRDTRLNEQV